MKEKKFICDRCKKGFNSGLYNDIVYYHDVQCYYDYLKIITEYWYKNLCYKCLDEVEFIVIDRYTRKQRKLIRSILEKIFKLKGE